MTLVAAAPAITDASTPNVAHLCAALQPTCTELLLLASALRHAAVRLDVARAAGNVTAMRSAMVDLMGAGAHGDLGHQVSGLIAGAVRAFERNVPSPRERPE